MTTSDLIVYGTGGLGAFATLGSLYACIQLLRPSVQKKYWESVYEAQRKEWEEHGGLTTLRFWVEWSEEDKQWVGRCNDLPSCSWLADTKEGALSGILQLVADEVEDLGYSNDFRVRAVLRDRRR